MSRDPNVVNTLRNKIESIEQYIISTERKLAEARADLAHVRATLALFEATGDTPEYPLHMGVHRLFRRGEIWSICKPALEGAPDGLDTRELALRVIEAKGLDQNDKVFRATIALSIVQVMGMRAKRGQATSPGKRKGVRIWQLKK